MLNGCRKCRRESEKLFLKGERCFGAKCAVVKRPYPPGSSGQKSQAFQSRLSDYGRQLREKQKAKRYFNVSEAQILRYYSIASNSVGNTSELLWQLLELRLDNVVRRSGVTSSIAQARQMVSHGAIKVNGKKETIPSRQLKTGDTIETKDPLIEKLSKSNLPKWISFDAKKKVFTVQVIPTTEELEAPFNINMVIEFYSK